MVYAAAAALLVSGLPWLLMTYAVIPAWIDEHAARSVEVWSLKAHGAAAMLGLVALGSLLPQHARWAWRARRNRRSGAMILGFAALLIATGYLLYYAGEETRNAASLLHQILGLMAPAGLVAHIALGRKRRVTARTTDRVGIKDQVVGSPLRRRDEGLASGQSGFSLAEIGALSAKDELRQP